MSPDVRGLANGGVLLNEGDRFIRTPYAHPLYGCDHAPDPHYIEQEARAGAVNKAWVEGSPKYQAAITLDLRLDDLARFRRGKAAATSPERTGYYEAMILQTMAQIAEARAVLSAGERRAAA